MGSTSRDDVVVLGEREFKRVKNGLDETQVASFIDELIKERDKLAQSQDHIASLNRLAERAVVEADKLAAQIKTEATEQAKAESAAIIDKAKEQARQMGEKTIAEAIRTANEQANAIRAEAEKQAGQLVENEKNKIKGELHNLVNQQFGYLLEELEHLKQQAAGIQSQFDNKLPEHVEQEKPVAVRVEEKANAAGPGIVEERDTIVAEVSKKMLNEQSEPGQATDHVEKSTEPWKLFQTEEQPESGKPQWELEILAPFDISKIMEVVSFLDQLPEVANTEMIVPQVDTPSILVFLHKPINIVDVLKGIPAVSHVEEVAPDTAATNGRPRKLRISLSGNTVSQGR
ncbi:MAG: DivIVA domain-containing protein [Dehalococcoidia bacterium]